jgi:AAA family ATP:ADP antiporter
MTGTTPQRIISRLLRPVTRVEPHEATTVVLMTVASFLLLMSYYLLKTVREPLILLHGGAEMKLYARASQAVLMVGFVYLYGELARRVGRMKLLVVVFLFFISNLVTFAVLAALDVPIALPFFFWVGLFSYTVVAQFWALAADIYTDEQGKRLFPVIGAGSAVGAVLGAQLAKSIMPFGPAILMTGSAIGLLACVTLIAWIERRANGSAGSQDPASPAARQIEGAAEEPLAREGAFDLLASDRYLLLIAAMVVVLNWVNSAGEYVLDRTLLVAAGEAATRGVSQQLFVGAFKADYYFWYNLLGVGLQLLVVSRLLKHLGVRRTLWFLPAFALVGYGAAAFLPTLAIMRLVKIGENGMQYSLQDTTRHALFLVTSRSEKYVGKTAVDTIAVRLGAILSAACVWLGGRQGWSLSTFALINVILAVAWIGLVMAIGREHRRRTAARPLVAPGSTEERAAAPASGLHPAKVTP